MEATMLFLLWITTLVFTMEALAQPKQFTISLICFILWNALAILCTSVTFIGFGSLNMISYNLAIGDHSDTYLVYIFHMIGIFFGIFAMGNLMQSSKETLQNSENNPSSPLRWL